MAASIADILLRNIATIQVGGSLGDASQLMEQQNANAVIVIQDNKVLGMLNKDDIALIQQNIDSQVTILASHIPSNSIAQLDLSMPLQRAFDFLFDHHRRQLVIINEHGEFEGLLTLERMIENLSEKSLQHHIQHRPDIPTDTENYYKQLMHAIP
ncbi:CBS domain-containing protein, partial [Mariprofundus ferrooxydans]|nr:CBS domain-containing protein [Mariprofundus ferrooxydans]